MQEVVSDLSVEQSPALTWAVQLRLPPVRSGSRTMVHGDVRHGVRGIRYRVIFMFGLSAVELFVSGSARCTRHRAWLHGQCAPWHITIGYGSLEIERAVPMRRSVTERASSFVGDSEY